MSARSRLLFVFFVLLLCDIATKAEDGLREVTTIDDNGQRWVRIIDERAETTSSSPVSTAESSLGVDDEDGDGGFSSGDGKMNERMKNSEFDVQNDEPIRRNDSVATQPTLALNTSKVSSTSTPAAKETASNNFKTTVGPTTVAKNVTDASTNELNATATTSSLEVSSVKPRENKTTTKPLTTVQAHDTTPSTSQSISTTLRPQIIPKTEPVTLKVSTTVSVLKSSTQSTQGVTTETIVIPEKTTEIPTTKPILSSATSKPSTNEVDWSGKPTESSNITSENVTSSKFTVKLTVPPKSTQQSVLPTDEKVTGDVQGQKSPAPKEKRKVLFGFVTLEILIALLAGALFSVLLVAFLVYRLKKRNEGSYELSETIALRPKELDEMGKKKEVFV
ncbi:syndecan-3 [Nematostella vectensis]|uniref:syndecan-3 n=1 Tax=Nematostella vectensis TaxID=45351 RepID=UPI0020776195|nr:syndecan-3 [Nematostella vectensis]